MPLIYFLGMIVIFFLQISAFIDGMALYFNLGTIVSVIIGFIMMSIPLGWVGVAIMTFYGAFYGWHWEWWQALMLAAPALVFMLIMMALGGAAVGISFLRRS